MRRAILGAALAMGLGPETSLASLMPCSEVVARWTQTSATTTEEEWARLYDDAFNESDCDGVTVAAVGQAIVDRFLPGIWEAFRAEQGSDRLQSLLARIDALGEYGSHWRIPFMRGEIARTMRDPQSALTAYQYALHVVDDEELTPEPPTEDEIELLRERLDEVAVVVAQLAPEELKLPVTRSGRVISQYSFSTRGYGRQKAVVPIQFVFDRDVMTSFGRSSLEDVLSALEDQGSPDIVVVGHTDPSGSNDYNLDLSRRRAAAVSRELLARGYTGEVETRGMGESRPFTFDDPGLYSEEIRNQAHRRVEVLLQKP